MIKVSDFCIYTDHVNEAKRKPAIDKITLSEYLVQEGYFCLYSGNQTGLTRCRVVDKRVEIITPNKFYTNLRDAIKVSHRAWLEPLMADWKLLTPIAMMQMNRAEPELLRDTENTSYIPFDNGILTITANGIALNKYSDVLVGDTCIMNDRIIHRNIDLSCSDYTKGVFYEFCKNAVGSDGLPYLMRALGFMLHTYKDRANSKMVVFADASGFDTTDANGGSGKSFLAYDCLSEIRNCHWIDGREFNPSSQFKFQGVSPEHEIVCLDDIPQGFKQSVIYNKITGAFSSEAKYKATQTIGFKDSAKFIITGNYGLVSEGESDKRRSIVIGFTGHYNSKNRPIDEFKHRFFDGWVGDLAIEYQYFYAFMAACIQQYLKYGMESYKHEEVARKGIISKYSGGIVGAIQAVKHRFIGAENAMLQKAWFDIIGRTETNTLEVLRKLMDADGYELASVRKKLKTTDAHASQLYYWKKK